MFVEIQKANSILRSWKNDPRLSKREIVKDYGWEDNNDPENNKPLTEKEVKSFKKFLRENNPTGYYELFPEDKA